MGGAHPFEDKALLPREDEALTFRLGRASDLRWVVASALVHGQGEDDGAIDHPRQDGRLLGFAASKAQGAGANEGRGKERGGREVLAEGLEHQAEGQIAEVRAAMGFGHENARPAHLDHALPGVGHDGRVGLAIAHSAELGDRVFVPHPGFRLVADERLFFR